MFFTFIYFVTQSERMQLAQIQTMAQSAMADIEQNSAVQNKNFTPWNHQGTIPAAQLFPASATDCHCWTSFKVNIQLDQ